MERYISKITEETLDDRHDRWFKTKLKYAEALVTIS